MKKRYLREQQGFDWEVYVIKQRIDNIVQHLSRMNTDLRVAREDLILLEEGFTADIKKLEKWVKNHE